MRKLAGAVWLLFAALGSAAAQPLDGWLPEETLFYLSLEDRSRTEARLAGGRYGGLRGDPAAQRLVIDARALLAQARRAADAKGDIWLGPFWELAPGQVVLAVVSAEGRPAPLVLLDLGARPEAFAEHLERLRESGVVGRDLSRDSRGDEVRVRPGAEGVGAIHWFQRGSVVAFSWRAAAIDAVLDHLRSGHGGLAARSDFAAVRGALPADADLSLFLPRAALEEIAARDRDAAAALGALGADAGAALGVTARLAPEALEVEAYLHAPGERRGLLALLEGGNRELAPPPFLPPDTLAFFAARLDIARLPRLAREMAPDDALALERLLAGESGELATSFLRALGDEFVLAYTGTAATPVLAAEVDREAWMRRFLADVAGRYAPARGGVHEGPDGALSLLDGWLLAGPRAEPLRRMRAQDPATGLAATRDYLHAAAALPERRVMLWYAAPARPRGWDDPRGLAGAQAGALVDEARGLRLVHRVALR